MKKVLRSLRWKSCSHIQSCNLTSKGRKTNPRNPFLSVSDQHCLWKQKHKHKRNRGTKWERKKRDINSNVHVEYKRKRERKKKVFFFKEMEREWGRGTFVSKLCNGSNRRGDLFCMHLLLCFVSDKLAVNSPLLLQVEQSLSPSPPSLLNLPFRLLPSEDCIEIKGWYGIKIKPVSEAWCNFI